MSGDVIDEQLYASYYTFVFYSVFRISEGCIAATVRRDGKGTETVRLRKVSIEGQSQDYLHWCSTKSPWSKGRKRRKNRGKSGLKRKKDNTQ